MARDVFQRYLKLARRALSDTAATAAAGAAGINTKGEALNPLEELMAAMQQQEEEGGMAPGGAGPASGALVKLGSPGSVQRAWTGGRGVWRELGLGMRCHESIQAEEEVEVGCTVQLLRCRCRRCLQALTWEWPLTGEPLGSCKPCMWSRTTSPAWTACCRSSAPRTGAAQAGTEAAQGQHQAPGRAWEGLLVRGPGAA